MVFPANRQSPASRQLLDQNKNSFEKDIGTISKLSAKNSKFYRFLVLKNELLQLTNKNSVSKKPLVQPKIAVEML